MNQIFDGVSADEFEASINQFIHREDPDALSLQALDEAARQQLAAVTTTRVEVTGRIQEGRIIFDTLTDAPILTHENELIIGGLHVVIQLREARISA